MNKPFVVGQTVRIVVRKLSYSAAGWRKGKITSDFYGLVVPVVVVREFGPDDTDLDVELPCRNGKTILQTVSMTDVQHVGRKHL